MGEKEHATDREEGVVPVRLLNQVACISLGKREWLLDESRNAGAQGRAGGSCMITRGIGDDHRVGAMSDVKFGPSRHDANTIVPMTGPPILHAGRIAGRVDVDLNGCGRRFQQNAGQYPGPSTPSDEGEPLQAVVYGFRHGACRTSAVVRDFRPDTTY